MIRAEDILLKYYEEGSALLNLLMTHSEMVARKALGLADKARLDVDRDFVWQAAMLHDIGIFRCDAPSIFCVGKEPYIRHGVIGAEIIRSLPAECFLSASPEEKNFCEAVARVCERHTGSGLSAKEIEMQRLPLPHKDFLPGTLEEKLICYADKFYSKSGNPTEEKSLSRVRSSLAKFGAESLSRFDALTALFAAPSHSGA